MTRLIPTAFLDRDGVLNVDHGYVHSKDQLDWVDGAQKAIARLGAAGFQVIVITNQAGIGRGYYSEDTMHAFHAHLADEIEAAGGKIAAFYHCPYHPDAKLPRFRHPDHPDRKPNPGMLTRAMIENSVCKAASFMIGDKQTDVEAAKAAGIPGFLFSGGNLDRFVADILDASAKN